MVFGAVKPPWLTGGSKLESWGEIFILTRTTRELLHVGRNCPSLWCIEWQCWLAGRLRFASHSADRLNNQIWWHRSLNQKFKPVRRASASFHWLPEKERRKGMDGYCLDLWIINCHTGSAGRLRLASGYANRLKPSPWSVCCLYSRGIAFNMQLSP